MNKHKKFIKDAYDGKHGSMCQDWKDTILEHYPEFKEEEFKVGDWVISHRYISPYIERFIDYDRKGDFITEKVDGGVSGLIKNDCRKATSKEVEEHLIAEAKRRGYQGGCMIVSLGDCYETSHCKGQKGVLTKEINFDYDGGVDALWADVVQDNIKDSLIIYEKGQWAEIINTMTKKEAEEKLGCKII